MENLWYNAKGLNERSASNETLALEKRRNIHLGKQVALLVAASFWSCPTVSYLRIRFSLYSLADVKSTGLFVQPVRRYRSHSLLLIAARYVSTQVTTPLYYLSIENERIQASRILVY